MGEGEDIPNLVQNTSPGTILDTSPTSNATLQVYLDILAGSKAEYNRLWSLANNADSITPKSEHEWQRTTVDFEQIAAARCRTILMFSSLSKSDPYPQNDPRYALTPVQSQWPPLDWQEVRAIDPPDAQMKSRLQVDEWVAGINNTVHNILFMDYNTMTNMLHQGPLAMGITTNETRFQNGYSAFATMLNSMANRTGPVLSSVLDGPRFVPLKSGGLAPGPREMWEPSDWNLWTRDSSRNAPLFLDTLEQQGNLWFLNHRVTEDFLKRDPKEHWVGFWKDRQDLAILSNCVFPDDRFKTTTRELTTEDQPDYVDAIEMAVGMIPYVGNIVSLGELITQHNLFQYRLNKFEMAIMAVFLFFPAAGKLFKPIARFNKVIEKVFMAGLSIFFKIPVKAGALVYGVLKRFEPMMGHSWIILKNKLLWTIREIFFLSKNLVAAIEKRWADYMEYLALLAKVFKQQFGIWDDLAYAGARLGEKSVAYQQARQDIGSFVKFFTSIIKTEKTQFATTVAGKSAAAAQKEAMKLIMAEYPQAVQAMAQKIFNEFPHLEMVLGPDAVQRIMCNFPTLSDMRGQIVEEIMATDISKALQQKYGHLYTGKSTDIVMEFIQNHRIRSLNNNQLTDGITGVLVAGDDALKKAAGNFDGYIHIFELAEAKLTHLDELKYGKRSITGAFDTSNESFRRAILDAYEYDISRSKPGVPIPPLTPEVEQKYAEQLKAGGQVLNDLLRIIKDGGVMIDGKRYKVVVPFGNVAEIKIRCFVPKDVISAVSIQNFSKLFKKRGLPNVEVTEIAAITKLQVEGIVNMMVTDIGEGIKAEAITLPWVDAAKVDDLLKEVAAKTQKLKQNLK